MMAGVFVLLALVAVATAFVVHQYRSTIEGPFRIGLLGWTILRGLLLVTVIYGLAISGRPSLQIVAVALLVLTVTYWVVERPDKELRQETEEF